MKLLIIIPTYNRKKQLKILLSQIKHQNINNSTNFSLEIVVVVDGSTDGTLEMLSLDFPGVHIVEGEGNWWFTKSLNEGLRFAKKLNPNFLLILNDDSEIRSNYLNSLMSDYKKLPKNGILGSITISKEKANQITYAGARKISWWRAKRHSYSLLKNENLSKHKQFFPSITLTARGMLIPNKILDKIGYFDEYYFPQYGSDDEFTLRAWRYDIPVFISYNCKLYDNTLLTGKGSPRLRPSFKEFVKLSFNKFSPVYLGNTIRLSWRYGSRITFPISLLFILLGHIYRYYKYKKLD